jgi:hypothetical protein
MCAGMKTMPVYSEGLASSYLSRFIDRSASDISGHSPSSMKMTSVYAVYCYKFSSLLPLVMSLIPK